MLQLLIAGVDSTFGEDVRTAVTASFPRLFGLFGEDSVSEADGGVPAGVNANTVGASANFPVESTVGVIEPALLQKTPGKFAKATTYSLASSRYAATVESMSSTESNRQSNSA